MLGSLKRHIPEGVVHVYGEVDVKDDSLLRVRYANAIHHAGRDEVRSMSHWSPYDRVRVVNADP